MHENALTAMTYVHAHKDVLAAMSYVHAHEDVLAAIAYIHDNVGYGDVPGGTYGIESQRQQIS
jgi:hypothetical protein